MIRVDRKKWEKYLTNVRKHLPTEFEDDCMNERLGEFSGGFIFMSFMKSESAKKCAETLVRKLGVDDGNGD